MPKAFELMTDSAVAAELGARIEALRLERNMTQKLLAEEIGLTPTSYRKLVAGEGKLVNVIAVMRALGQVAAFEKLLPETTFSPMEQLKLKGKVRQRASRVKTKAENASNELDW